MSAFSIGLSALRANQLAMDTVGQNLSNAGTEGYHRQAPIFQSVETGGQNIGLGVRVADIRRFRNQLLEEEVTRQTFQSSDTTAQLDTSRQIESFLNPGTGTLDDLLNRFYNQLQQLSSRPEDASLRRVAIDTGSSLASGFNALANNFDTIRAGLDDQMRQVVGNINRLSTQIAKLNGDIAQSEGRGFSANDARDQRDQLINQLAQLVDVRTIDQGSTTTVLTGSVPLVIGESATSLSFSTDSSDHAIILAGNSPQPQQIQSGQLAGLLQMRNVSLPEYRTRLDTLANQVIKNIDGVQATGLGLSGPLPFVSSTRPVANTAVPLTQAKLAIPPQQGQLFVTVTDPAGNRTLTQLNIDPNGQSLQDIANLFNGIPNLSATVNPQSGLMQIVAAPGYTFDFAGRLATAPTNVVFTDPTPPTVQATGTYAGVNNDVFTCTFSGVTGPGPGVIGVTPGLKLNVTNAAGQAVATLNVGQSYTPASDLLVADGISVHLSAGNVNNGDHFDTQVVAQPDTAGLLTSRQPLRE